MAGMALAFLPAGRLAPAVAAHSLRQIFTVNYKTTELTARLTLGYF